MMLSKVAERIFWMARYLERTENTARLINVQTSLLMDMPEEMEINWFSLIKVFAGQQLYYQQYDVISEENIMNFIIADKNNPSSLKSSISHVKENARTSLDQLPEEMWEQINHTNLLMESCEESLQNRHFRQQLLQTVHKQCQCIRGILDSNLSRNQSYYFTQLGKHIERIDMVSRIIEVASLLLSDDRSEAAQTFEGIIWSNLLQALSAYQMYLQKKRPPVTGNNVVDFLIKEDSFPRSMNYSIHSISGFLKQLPHHSNVVEKLQSLSSLVDNSDFNQIPSGQLHFLMDTIQSQLNEIQVEVTSNWFYPDIAA